jgi:sugar/nucleoside kinase (ribokinase family)
MNIKGLFIGLTTLDIQYFVTEHPQANTKIKAEPPVIAAGGPAANAAVAFAFLGGKAQFITCIGQNDFSGFLKSNLEEHNIRVSDAMESMVFRPIAATVITNTTNSDRTIVTHHPEPGIAENTSLSEIDFIEYDFVFSDGFYPEIALPIMKSASKKNIPVIFDGGSWKPQMPELLPFVDIAIFSNNFRPKGCNSYAQIFSYIKEMGIKHAAISRGDKPILTSDGTIDVEQLKAVDSLAAGDFLHGAFCYYYFESLDFTKALKKASNLASFTTLYKGSREWMKKWRVK